VISIDDYNNTHVQKLVYEAHQKGLLTDDLRHLYYHNSIDYPAVAGAITASRRHIDVTLIEGIFLFKNALNHLLDVKVFLPISQNTARKRYAARKEKIGDDRPLSVFDDIWLPSFERYCRETRPEDTCDFTYPSSFTRL